MKKSTWFKNLDCTQLEIINYKSISDDTSVGMTTIKDVAFVKKVAEQINSLPSDGDEKISWKKSTKRTLLSFKCANDEWVNIEIIGNKFKTPTTGFNSEKNAIEETLAQDLQLLASPQLGGRILKIKDYVVRFKDFQITFTGSEHTPQPPGGPTIGPTNNNFYRINVKDSGNTIDATIYDGQMPPGPLAFVAGKKIYYLLTYSFAKERLLPNYFVVTDKLPNRR